MLILNSKLFKKVQWGVVIVTLVYFSIFVLMLPLFNNAWWDDFAYIQSARNLILGGQMKLHEWVSLTLISQMVWAKLVSFFLGYSIVTLKISVVILAYFALLAFYFLLRELNVDETLSTLLTILFLACPWFLLLAYSFMTDVPYISWFVISLFFYISGFKRDRRWLIIAGSFFSSLAFLTRQTGFLLPLSILPAILIFYIQKNQKEKIIPTAIDVLFLPLATIVGYYFWLKTGNHETVVQIVTDRVMFLGIRSFVPTKLSLISRTVHTYSDTVWRVGFYIIELLAISWPVILIFKPNLKQIKKIFNWKFLLLYLTFFVPLGITLLWKSYYQISWPDLSNLLVPRELMEFRKYFPLETYQLWWGWGISVMASFPFATLFLTAAVKVFWEKYFYFKLRISVRTLWICLSIMTALMIMLFLPSFYKDIKTYDLTTAFLDHWVMFLIYYSIIVLLFFIYAGVRLKIRITSALVDYILLFSFLANLFFLFITPYNWPRYVLTFVPYVILLVALASKYIRISNIRLVLVTFAILTISFMNAKTMQTIHGAIWEAANELVSSRGVDPADIDTQMMAWYPYWYYEKNYDYALTLFNQDKTRFVGYTSWQDADTTKGHYSANFLGTDCPAGTIVKNHVDTLFIKGYACVTATSF